MLLYVCFAEVVLNVLNLIGKSTSQLKTNVSMKQKGIIRHTRDAGVPHCTKYEYRGETEMTTNSVELIKNHVAGFRSLDA